MRNLPVLARRVAIVAVSGLALATATAVPAWAHTELVAADPAVGGTVSTAVTTLTLTFTEPVPAADTTIDVTGPDGSALGVGDVRSSGANALRDVRPLPAGLIRVAWRTVSLDGDPVRGEYSFTNTYVAPSPTPSPAGPPATPSAPAPAPASAGTTTVAAESGSSATGWVIVGLVVLAVLVGAGVWLARRRRST